MKRFALEWAFTIALVVGSLLLIGWMCSQVCCGQDVRKPIAAKRPHTVTHLFTVVAIEPFTLGARVYHPPGDGKDYKLDRNAIRILIDVDPPIAANEHDIPVRFSMLIEYPVIHALAKNGQREKDDKDVGKYGGAWAHCQTKGGEIGGVIERVPRETWALEMLVFNADHRSPGPMAAQFAGLKIKQVGDLDEIYGVKLGERLKGEDVFGKEGAK